MASILILTAGFGDGHNAAARNLCDALEQISPDAEVTVADVYDRSYKRLNRLARQAYLGAVRYTPRLWAGFFKLLDKAPWLADGSHGLGRLRQSLAQLLETSRPDCVVCTYPSYTQLLHALFRDHCEKPFRLLTVITDARSINSVWYRAPSDAYLVCDAETAKVLQNAGVPAEKIQALGFPVSPRFAVAPADPPQAPRPGQPFRVLYVINTGKKKTGKALDRLLDIPEVELTVTVGRHAELKEKLARRAARYGSRLHVLGWTNQMPELLMRSHLVIGKAGGAAVQEALAARCPMLVNQVIPGQEDGNARLIEELGVGAVAEKSKAVARWVRHALQNKGALWRQWRERLERSSRPDAALSMAHLVLEECERASHAGSRPEVLPKRRVNGAGQLTPPSPVAPGQKTGRALLCDFHIHTNYSDGRLTVPEVVDFYGLRGFDCICITDHWTDPSRLIGKLSRLTPFTLSYDQIEEYFEVIAREARRAWRRYGMLVLTGLEFNKDGPTSKSSAHLLGIDLKEPISPRLDLWHTVDRIHAQGGLAVASHPHVMKSEWAKDTLYLWEHQDEFAPVIDAWEIANRNNLFAPVSLKRLPFLANSDFHKPKHIYSWKTLVHCPKEPEAIKECIRRNEDISITLYRGAEPGEAAIQTGSIPLQVPARERSPALELFEAQLPQEEPLVLPPARVGKGALG
jgi:UDP-N-acetylglucosamine:LPS N-acetylglucosamine transferase/predicted metal-dependent phosphoesterase TrpH